MTQQVKMMIIKQYSNKVLLTGIAAALSVTLAGCSGSNILPDKRVEYKSARQADNALEIPPDLSRDQIAYGGIAFGSAGASVTTFSQYQAGRAGTGIAAGQNVLPESPQVEIKRDGDKRWLVVQATPDAVWNKVLDYWQDAGVLLIEQDPVAGVMRTDWIENRANIKSDAITNFLRRTFDSLYSTGTRDQFRTRLERGPDGTTEIYLTHTAMAEKLITGAGGTDTDQSMWTPAPSDPELEAVMLQRLVAFMGAAESRAGQAAAGVSASSATLSSLTTTGTMPMLNVETDYARAWRLVGISMSRVGFTVEDRDRSAGTYYVRYNDPDDERYAKSGGALSKLAFWNKSEQRPDAGTPYQVQLTEQNATLTQVTVRDENGVPVASQTAMRILTLIDSQLR